MEARLVTLIADLTDTLARHMERDTEMFAILIQQIDVLQDRVAILESKERANRMGEGR